MPALGEEGEWREVCHGLAIPGAASSPPLVWIGELRLRGGLRLAQVRVGCQQQAPERLP